MNLALDAADGAFDLGMPLMADEDDLAPVSGIALAFLVDLGDQRAGGVDHRQAAPLGRVFDRLADAMGAEHGDRALRYLVDLVDEHGALVAQGLDDMFVVDDLVAHIDRRPVDFQGALDNRNRPLDAGAESPWCRKNDFHRPILYSFTAI